MKNLGSSIAIYVMYDIISSFYLLANIEIKRGENLAPMGHVANLVFNIFFLQSLRADARTLSSIHDL